jgi:hypothetical protein
MVRHRGLWIGLGDRSNSSNDLSAPVNGPSLRAKPVQKEEALPRTSQHNGTIALIFLALTALVTYPQVRGLGTSVPYHSDPYFSMWRLAWVAHAIQTDPRGLFEANIFYPAHDTLGYSDAMLLPGTAVAPLFWAGMNPVLIYNLALFGAFALSGYAAFLLARVLTDSVTGSIVAGVIYAFAPYRFCHYMHLELQMVFWIPFALLLVHRIVAKGRVRDGVLLGLTVAAQLLSSVYLGTLSLVYVAVLMPALLVLTGVRHPRRLLVATAVGAGLTIAIVAPYVLGYSHAVRGVRMRSLDEVRIFSASMTNYLSAPAMNRLYGWTAGTDRTWADEMNLFPGVLACALACLGILRGRGPVRFAYLAGLAASVEMTRGSSSFVYPWLFEHVAAFRALRSPARFDTLVNLSLGVLSAYGVAFLLAGIEQRRWRQLAGAALVAVLIAEYASSPLIAPVPGPTRIDALLAKRPPSVIVELPLLSRRGFWGSLDSIYMYQGIGHFQRMLNGYSGHAPASFYQMRDMMASFPDDRSMTFLRNLQVDYVVVRAGLYEAAPRAALLEQIGRVEDLSLEAMWPDGPMGAEVVYRIKRETNQK